MKSIFQKPLLWLSQYQLTLLILAGLSICSAIWLPWRFWEYLQGIEPFSGYWFIDSGQLPLPLSAWLKVIGGVIIMFVSLHLLCIAWIRTLRNRQHIPFILFLSLLAVYLPLFALNFLMRETFSSIHAVGETRFFMESIDRLEMNVFREQTDTDSIGIYTLPFSSLKTNQPITHPDWDFTLVPDTLLPRAGIGGPQSKVVDAHNRPQRGITADNGVSRDLGLRLYSTRGAPTKGRGLKLAITPSGSRSIETYLLYAAFFPNQYQSLSSQQIECSNSNYLIGLFPKRKYPHFSWKVSREGNSQWLNILDSKGKREIKSFPFTLGTKVKFKGYTFMLRIPPISESSPSILHVSISTVPLGFIQHAIEWMMISSLILFLFTRVFSSIAHKLESEERP